jgi:hypothetical protein
MTAGGSHQHLTAESTEYMHQYGHGDRSDTRGRARHRRAAALAMLVAAATVAGTLASQGASATITPGAPTMPPALNPGSVTTPLFPVRTVPAFATPTHIDARVRPYNGGSDQRFEVPTPPGSVLLWGDWNRDGAYTPAIYTSGHWVIYDQMIGSAPVPTREFDYGAPGDRPVVGDFNKDGRTDIGVVRGNVWLLRKFPSAGVTWRHFAFGRATDTPVVGDWDGDGRDGVGVRRGAHWYLLQQPKASAPAYTFTFGRRTDTAVVGDWDGNRADTVGAVRSTNWYLRDRLSRTPTKGMTRKHRRAEARSTVTTREVNVPREPGTVPAPWPTPAGPSGAACATASSGVANRDQASPFVRPSLLLHKALPYDPANPSLSTDPVFQLRTSLLDSERYLLGAQYLDRWFSRRGERFTDVLARFTPTQQEYAVRRPAMAALTTAVAVATGAHNDASVGRTKDEAIRYTDWLVRSVACDHVAVTPGGWGGGWQTAHWAMLAGEAAWLIWDQLTPQTREYVAQMIVYEADAQLTKPVAYWADANGTVVSRGDTHAEEDSWNAALLELAVDMMPRHPQAPNWRRRAVDLETASYATFSDLNSGAAVNGVSLADRLDGANAYDNGTVENHQVIQPDYMTNIEQDWWAADFAGLAGRKAPVAAFHNATLVYGAFTTVSFTPGDISPANGLPYQGEGGTIYKPGNNDIYFPQTTIWGTQRRGHFVGFDAHAYAYGLDTTATWSARDAMAAHLTGQQALVATDGTGDGRTYNLDPATANSEDTYNGREEYAASQLAEGWLALYVSRNAWDQQFNLPALDDATYLPLPPLTTGQTGWSAVQGSSPQGERLSP